VHAPPSAQEETKEGEDSVIVYNANRPFKPKPTWMKMTNSNHDVVKKTIQMRPYLISRISEEHCKHW